MACRCSPFPSLGQIRLQGIKIYDDRPALAVSLKKIEKDLEELLNPDARTRKRLETALSR